MRTFSMRLFRAALVIPALLAVGCLADRLGAPDPDPDPSGGEPPPPPPPPPPVDPGPVTPRIGFHVTTTGSSGGDGSTDRPWNLATALAHPAAVQPGDTIWVHGGTYPGCYTGRLTGTATLLVVLRQLPGARATIDGAGCSGSPLTVNGAYAAYWGLEVMNSNPRAGGSIGVNVFGDEVRLINLVIHDNGQSGVGAWSEATGGEIYGSIIYNNGVHDNLDHAIYAQNSTGTKHLVDNVMFNQWAYGIHLYGSSSASLVGFEVAGNTSFNNGMIGPNLQAPNILVGGDTPVGRTTVTGNMTYQTMAKTGVRIGYGSVTNTDVTVRDNYFAGGSPVMRMTQWTQAAVTGNTFLETSTMVALEGTAAGVQWSGNSYTGAVAERRWTYGGQSLTFDQWRQATGLGAGESYSGSTRAGTRVFVRPNRYEPGRANIIVYNWAHQGTVAADVSQVLTIGDAYEVRNVQDFFGSAVLQGTYDGAPLQLPMAAVTPPAPLGGAVNPPPVTGPEFNVFVLLPR